jgi:hypothetical protein
MNSTSTSELPASQQDDAEQTRVMPSAVVLALAKCTSPWAARRAPIVVQEVVDPHATWDPRAEPDEVAALDHMMFNRLAARDREGALRAAEDILALCPTHREARAACRHCRVILEATYREALGPELPVARVGVERLVEAVGPCGTAFAFVLKAGTGSLADLLATSEVPALETLRVLLEMTRADLLERSP